MMKPSAYLVNTARAALVNEAAMLNALHTGKIAGAAVDIFHQEPINVEHPLLQMSNVIAVSRIAGVSHNVKDHHACTAFANLLGFLNGNVQNVVNPTSLDRAHVRIATYLDTKTGN